MKVRIIITTNTKIITNYVDVTTPDEAREEAKKLRESLNLKGYRYTSLILVDENKRKVKDQTPLFRREL